MRKEHTVTRRGFLKGAGALGLGAMLPEALGATPVDPTRARFNQNLMEQNNAQTIVLYLHGGASELAGNMTNFDEIKAASQNPYPTRYMSRTQNDFWQQAGGNALERMLDNGDVNIYRTCYRTVDASRDHGRCSSQAQCGRLDMSEGIATTLASILQHHNALSFDPNDLKSTLPFVTLDSNTQFYRNDDGVYLSENYRPVTLNSSKNPYRRSGGNEKYVLDPSTGQTASEYLDALAQRFNVDGVFNNFLTRRKILDSYLSEIQTKTLPDGVEYPQTTFGKMMKDAVTIMIDNPYTKLLTLGTAGLGGWDDHSNAIGNYINRMRGVMETVEAALDHIKSTGKTNINIVIFSEFGRNVNYNDAQGWDHGNNQTVYWFGGWDYFARQGIVGKTELSGSGTRLFTRPTADSYQFQVFSIAATLYKLYGIENPEDLTDGNAPIQGIFS